MGNDLTMGYTNCCGGTGYYDRINTISRGDLQKTKIIVKVNQQLDTYTSKMLDKKIRELMNEIAGTLPTITVPAPYKISVEDSKQDQSIKVEPISCIDIENISLFGYTHKWLYHLPVTDEYYGDLNHVHKYDNINKYNRVNNTRSKYKVF